MERRRTFIQLRWIARVLPDAGVVGWACSNVSPNRSLLHQDSRCKQAWLLKNSLQEIRRKYIASGCPINDLRRVAWTFSMPSFGMFSENATPSTVTGDFTHNPVVSVIAML